MRASKKMGVLSDKYIKENYSNCFLPIPVDKLHSVRQKPSGSFVNTANKRIKDYISLNPVIPQYIAENASSQKGILGLNEMNSIKSDLIRKAANAKSNYSILQPPRKREGVLQENIGFTQISSMAQAQDVNFGKIDTEFVKDELLDQAPLGAYGDKVNFNTLLGSESVKSKENMTPSGSGVKKDLAKILDPGIESTMFLINELKRQPESYLFTKPQKPGQGQTVQQDGANLILNESEQVRDQAQTFGPSEVLPEVPQVASQSKVPAETTLSKGQLSKVGDSPIIYKDRSEASSLQSSGDVPNVSDPSESTVDILRAFLLKHLEVSGDSGKLKKYLDSKPRSELKRLTQKYFPKMAGSPLKGTPKKGKSISSGDYLKSRMY